MNATTDNGEWQNRAADPTRSAAELEREGEELRAGLDRTLDEIERKFSPGEFLDRSMEFLRTNGSEFLADAGETVRRNPVPVLLTAVGLVWLTTSVLKSRTAASSEDAEAEDLSMHHGSGYGPAGRAGELKRKATRKLSNSVDAMKGRTKDAMHAVQQRTQGAGSYVSNLVQEQPVALGALALAAGALVGASIPITPYENRMVGPVHDRTMARAKELGQREYESLRETVASSLKGTSGSGPDEGAK